MTVQMTAQMTTQMTTQIFSESKLSELNIIYNKNDDQYQHIMDECFRCIYGISFIEFYNKYTINKHTIIDIETMIKEKDDIIKEKDDLIKDLTDDINQIRENYWDMHQKVIKYESIEKHISPT